MSVIQVRLLLTSILLSTTVIFSVAFASINNQSVFQGHWVQSNVLTPGMKILTADNKVLVVEKNWIQRKQKLTTYNFEVAQDHTYFVGHNKLWAHNTGVCDEDDVIDLLLEKHKASEREKIKKFALKAEAFVYTNEKNVSFRQLGLSDRVGKAGSYDFEHAIVTRNLHVVTDDLALTADELNKVFTRMAGPVGGDSIIYGFTITLDEAAYASASEIQAVVNWAKSLHLDVIRSDGFIHIGMGKSLF